MGFFGDLKEDLSMAVNEMLPDENGSENAEVQMPADEDAFAAELAAMAAETETTVQEPEVVEATAEESAAVDAAFADLENTANLAQAIEAPVEEAVLETPVAEVVAEEKKEDKGVGSIMDSIADKEAVDETSVITQGMKIKGDLASAGSLDLLGCVIGDLEVLGKLNVTGEIKGNAKAREIFAENAKINGDVVSETSVKVGAGTVIVGNISALSAAIAGAVKGDIDVHGPVILDSTAIVMGNIRSKSVQINNGAAIEGLCSQCYADVSPTAFFDDYQA